MDFIDSVAAGIILTHNKHLSKETTRPDFLPDKDEITTAINLLRRLIFPGYFDENGARGEDLQCVVRNLAANVERILQRQICCALNLEAADNNDLSPQQNCGVYSKEDMFDYSLHSSAESNREGIECADMFAKAGNICHSFLNKIPYIIEVLLSDVQAAYDGDPAARSKHEIIFAYPGIFAISIYRLAHELFLLEVPYIPRMMTEYAHSLTGIDIHPGADIDRHFFIDHGTGIVIGETTKIGAHVKLYQGVTLGALSTRGGQSLRGKKRHPTLEDDVTVYSGASILGGDTVIGKGSVIGGNVFITQSVPPDTRVYL